MKLDRFKFAMLAAWIGHRCEEKLTNMEIGELDFMTEIDVEPVSMPSMCNPETLHVFMSLMHEGTRKIEAIKQHRMMTGYGLKESKDIVEKYWVPRPIANDTV